MWITASLFGRRVESFATLPLAFFALARWFLGDFSAFDAIQVRFVSFVCLIFSFVFTLLTEYFLYFFSFDPGGVSSPRSRPKRPAHGVAHVPLVHRHQHRAAAERRAIHRRRRVYGPEGGRGKGIGPARRSRDVLLCNTLRGRLPRRRLSRGGLPRVLLCQVQGAQGAARRRNEAPLQPNLARRRRPLGARRCARSARAPRARYARARGYKRRRFVVAWYVHVSRAARPESEAQDVGCRARRATGESGERERPQLGGDVDPSAKACDDLRIGAAADETARGIRRVRHRRLRRAVHGRRARACFKRPRSRSRR